MRERGSGDRSGLCAPGALLVHLLLASLVSLLLSAGRLDDPSGFWLVFGLTLLLVIWITCLSLAVLCQIERRGGLESRSAMTASIILVFTVTTLLTSLLLLLYWPVINPIWFVFRNTVLAGLLSLGLVRFLSLQSDWKRQVAAESAARLNALQARIRPHFLFNALNTIAGVIHENPERAEEATLDLADLLRTGLSSDDRHSLDDELELVRRYLRLESLRLGERLQVAWELAEDLPLDESLPPLLLQPLVENAVVHGISRRTDGGTVLIRGERVRFGRIRLTITNPLAGADGRSSSGTGTALENIRQRLALAYEERYGLRTWIEGGQFQAELTIPVD